jgi:glucose-1-phosphate thymidylyltransferase
MLLIKERPLLFFIINALKNAGCNNIVIVVDYLAEQIKDYFGDGEGFGVKIQYAENVFVSTYDAVYKSLHLLDDSFYYCHGNIVFEERLLENIWKMYCDTGHDVMAVLKDAYSITHSKLRLNGNNTVAEISLQPESVDQQVFNYTFMGVAIYNKSSIMQSFDGDYKSMTEKHILSSLKKGVSTSVIEYLRNWWHIETIEDYFKIKDKYFWEVIFK